MTDPAELLAHVAPAILLDEVLNATPTAATTALIVRPSDRFARAGLGVPAHVAIEWMAQTCAVCAGQEAAMTGRPIRLGMLLGTRRFRAGSIGFGFGERLVVRVARVFHEAGMGVFDCSVHDAAGTERACAQLTVYQPPDETA